MNSKTAGQLAAAAAISSVISIGALLAYQRVSKERRRSKLAQEILDHLDDGPKEPEPQQSEFSMEDKEYEANETIIREQLARNYAFFGEEGMNKIRGSRVAVVGCGGVGSWASVM